MEEYLKFYFIYSMSILSNNVSRGLNHYLFLLQYVIPLIR